MEAYLGKSAFESVDNHLIVLLFDLLYFTVYSFF
jgi:hypothetical protein